MIGYYNNKHFEKPFFGSSVGQFTPVIPKTLSAFFMESALKSSVMVEYNK